MDGSEVKLRFKEHGIMILEEPVATHADKTSAINRKVWIQPMGTDRMTK